MIFDQIINSISEGEAEETYDLTKAALSQGYPASVILEKGLLAGMNKIASKFRAKNVVVPEVLMATSAMHAGLSLIEPYLIPSNKKQTGKVVVGTVSGDLHDIGITLVKTMVMSLGIKVIDLGVDVSPKKFASAIRKEKPNILMLSALLTTTMSIMKNVIQELEAQKLRKDVKIFVGGAPITEAFAKEIGADYYFEDAFDVRDYFKDNYEKLFPCKDQASGG